MEREEMSPENISSDIAHRAGNAVSEAVRGILDSTNASEHGNVDMRKIFDGLHELPAGPVIYQAIALCAATIRWASRETGRPEETILQELVRNYGDIVSPEEKQ